MWSCPHSKPASPWRVVLIPGNKKRGSCPEERVSHMLAYLCLCGPRIAGTFSGMNRTNWSLTASRSSWGGVLRRLPALSTPGAAGWASGLSLSAEAAPSRYVSIKTETQGSAVSLPAQPPLVREACAALKPPGRVKVSSKVLVWDLGEDVPKSALIYKSGPPCTPPYERVKGAKVQRLGYTACIPVWVTSISHPCSVLCRLTCSSH